MSKIFGEVFNRNFSENIHLLQDAVITRSIYINTIFNRIDVKQNCTIVEIQFSLSEKIKRHIRQFNNIGKGDGNTLLFEPIVEFTHDELYFLLIACEHKINSLETLQYQLDIDEITIVIEKYEEITIGILDVFDTDDTNQDNYHVEKESVEE